MNNIFVGANGADPLLGGNPYTTPNTSDLQSQIERLQQAKQQMDAHRQQVGQQPPVLQSRTPVWDEIDNMVNGMTDSEVQILNENEEYLQSQQSIMMLLQREYMAVMRPIVENTKDGKDALDKHLTLAKRLKKTVTEEANKGMALFSEYTTKYSTLSWDEFLKMKQAESQPVPKEKGGKK